MHTPPAFGLLHTNWLYHRFFSPLLVSPSQFFLLPKLPAVAESPVAGDAVVGAAIGTALGGALVAVVFAFVICGWCYSCKTSTTSSGDAPPPYVSAVARMREGGPQDGGSSAA